MNEAAETWALLIGIDAYLHVRKLTGAVRDTVQAVGWLRRLGVPDAQILLHAAPTAESKAELIALGLPVLGCTEPEIWPSFETLGHNQGKRLFVFFCGHGLYEPVRGRVFLTQEARKGLRKNLGIDWYARYLRGLPYRRQFLVMDGCLNYPYSQAERTRFVPGQPSSVEPDPPRADVLQVFCYAAAMSQRAVEKDGHGLFLHTLLKTLDLDDPDRLCLDIDETSGVYRLNLDQAVTKVVAPTVTQIAKQQRRDQSPGYQMLSEGATPPALPVVEIVPTRRARVRVTVDPADAAADVKQLMLWSDDTAWRRELPIPPSKSVQVPYESVIPAGLPVAVRCRVPAGGRWAQPAQEEFVADRDFEVLFQLEPPAPPPAGPDTVVSVQTVGSGGDVIGGMSAAAYKAVEQLLTGNQANVSLVRHESGPVLHSHPGFLASLAPLAYRMADAINRTTSRDVGVVVRHPATTPLSTAVALPLTEAASKRLAGLLVHEDVVSMCDQHLSLDRLVWSPFVAVDPGPVTVQLSLPWGSWVHRVVVRPGSTETVVLPESIGTEPLRVRLLAPDAGAGSEDPPRSLVSARRSPVTGRMRSGTDVVGDIRPTEPLGASWRGRWSQGSSGGVRWATYCTVSASRGQFSFPINEHGALAVHLGRSPRVEPLSRTPSAHWDRLISAGRLEELGEEEATRLTDDKWSAPLLGLAGAYACYAQRRDDYLRTVLGNLGGLDGGLPDLPLLEAAVDQRQGRVRAEVRGELERLARARAVPVFRWGVAIGVTAAQHYHLPSLADWLARVDARLVPTSTWTLWRDG
ncbi:hypothetical protein JD79_04395 [Geodermatophilus normandii]|uniref:Caspase domain-containing protein n=1 Tax=Geodermatophilus normandii TaxID=1137989 RepID=A0A317QQN3_9ACTN|nr:hypothetical protein [Geodermatophilus normandii]PWW25197.1 hypothetical protein JD79_04395 [Geodermatophilus normandii]